MIRGSSRLLQRQNVAVSLAVPLRCSTGPDLRAGDEAELWMVWSFGTGAFRAVWQCHIFWKNPLFVQDSQDSLLRS